MVKILILLMTILLFVSSCAITSKDVNSLVKKNIEESIKEIPVKELIIANKSNNLVTPLVIALFVGVVLLATGVRTIGIGVIVASITCIILMITVTIFTKTIAVIGVLVLVVSIIFLAKRLWDNKIFEKEMIKSVEKAKTYISGENREKLKIELNKEQSKETKKIVKKLKGK